MMMIVIESRTPRVKNAGPTVPVLNLGVSGKSAVQESMIESESQTYVKIFMLAENQTKNIWYHRVSRRSSAGTGAILIHNATDKCYDKQRVVLTRAFQFHSEKVVK